MSFFYFFSFSLWCLVSTTVVRLSHPSVPLLCAFVSVSLSTGIPVSKLLTTEKDRLLQMDKILAERVVGQEDAILVVTEAIQRSRAGLSGKCPCQDDHAEASFRVRVICS